MESEFERILRREQNVSAVTTGVLLIVGVTMLLLGWFVEFAASVSGGGNVLLILAAFGFIGYYRLRQSKVNVELAKAIRDMRERLDQGVREEDG
jgi:uncharacterized membrane protein